MWNPAKRSCSLFARKACALLLAYCFFATSLWSATGSGAEQAGRRPAEWTTLTGAGMGDIERALSREHPIASRSINNTGTEVAGIGKERWFNNFAELNAPPPPVAMQSGSSGGATATVGIFGPQQYVRTTGNPNTYTTTVQVPAWVVSPFNLHIQSGEADGSHRVSSATITVNNVQVAGTSDFNQTVFTLDRSVTLTPTTTMVVTLASKPGSYLRINLSGQSNDHTPPLLTIAAPVTNSAINTPQAHLDLHYQDLPGAGETAASGVNTTTLQVLLDGVDRTSLFVKRSDEATADLPASLALSPGPHTLSASIKDNAGNIAQATSQFQLDVTPPTLQILQPAIGSYLNTTTPQIQLAFSDNFAIDPSTLRVSINGVDRTSVFAVTATGATGVSSTPLATGANSIVATIADKAGNQAHASASFNVDTTPPVITILHPASGSLHGSSTVEFSIQFSDDQAIDTNSLQVSVDGAALGLTLNQNLASASSTLSDGSHTVTATIKDKAGNQGSASSTFIVNTTIPDIHITQPAPGAILNSSSVQLQLNYGDNTSVDASTLQVSVDGVNVTPSLSVTSTTASGLLQGPLAEGNHAIAAQIASQTGNTGHESTSFFIDTIKPQLTIVSPAGAVNTTFPSALAQYSDSGSGINSNSIRVFLDGTDVTSSFSVGASSIQGAFTTALSEGTHQLRVTVADRAGNIADQTASFQVDVTAPTASFTSPANNAFTNNVTPSVVLAYSDGLSGVDANSVHIFLQPLNGAETEITSAFTLGASQASGTIVTPLAPGTWHLHARVADKAGNITDTDSAFAVDTTAPTYSIDVPAANAFLKSATPTFVVSYQDDSSGVDPHQFALRIDGTDHTASMSATETGASGTLQSTEALSEGPHQVEVTVVDRAGNQAAVVPQPFFVDTIAPLISITAPAAAAFTNNSHLPIAVSYSDSGSGIDATSFRILIDGIDHTAEFTAIDTGASGTPVAALADGTHSISVSISDAAGNTSTATSSFVVDTIPPQITITQPVDGIFTNAVSVIVSGSVVDASPVTVTVEGTTVPLQGNTFTSAAITLGASGPQVLHVTATDAAGNSSEATPTLKIDRTPPVISGSITPAPNSAGWNNTAVTVTFTCSDADSGIATCPAPVPVDVEGANQSILGTAVDKAGNTAQAAVKVSIDKTAPVITATPAPAPNAAGWNITDVTISYACSDNLSGVAACPAPQVVNAEGKAQPITATITDQAGNTATSTVILNIEKTAPTIAALLSPAANAAGWNKTDVTVSFNCTPSVSDIVTCQPPVTVTTEGKAQSIPGSVTDQAGKTASTTAIVNIDKTAPLITASAAPGPNGAGWNNTDVVISYVCSDSLSGIAVCPPPAQVSAEGANEIVTGQATDQAGNTAVATSTLNIDKTPPTITATSAPPANSAGWNNTDVTVSFSCSDNLSGVASCPAQTQVSSEGQNQPVPGQAVDVAGNVAAGSITVSIDKTAPSIVQISAPDHISRLHGGQIDVTVNDNFTVTQVVISLNGSPLTTSTVAPYQAPLQVPAGANPGDTLTISVQATDEAGNVQTASRGVRVAADGVVVGQVLSDTTSFPVQGASVQAIAKTTVGDQTDDHGRYSLQVSDSHLFVTASSPTTTTVDREVFVQEGVGTVPVDARLTPLASPVVVGSGGGSIKTANITLSVPAGSVSDGTNFQLTSLSGQGLPGLLPLGWSPLAAFDVRASSPAANILASITQLPNTVFHLASYDPSLHAWLMVSPNLQAVNGTLSAVLPSAGSYALVIPDAVDPPIAIPNVGSALAGIDMQLLPPASSSSGSLSPAILPPSGGTATATLGVQSPSFVPSGTVLQANVSERFSLKSGDVASQENRSEDIVLYTALAPSDSSLGAKFVVSPSRKFSNAELLTGKVHLDIMAGREGVRGQSGGSNPLQLSDGVSTLFVPGGALSEDTAISIESIALENFIPTTSSAEALQEVVVDFSGETLGIPAQISTSSAGLNPSDTFLLAKVARVDGIPRITMAALAQINGASLISVASPGLPGVTEGGEYVFYHISAPSGFVRGTVTSNVGPVQALIQSDSLPLASISGADGKYIIPVLAGTANLKANIPHTGLIGSVSITINAGQTAQADIQLAGAVTVATVSPADGSLGVAASTVITITTSAPLNLQSISQNNLVLLKGTAAQGQPVAIQPFVLSSSGTVLSFAPQKNLDPATQYTIEVTGLADVFGGAVVVLPSTFITKAVAPPNFNPDAITFAFPDANGNIHVSAPAGSLPPGTKVLIIDQTSGLVLSLTALNDGSVAGDFLGSINDVLQITVTDPTGATASFTKSQFVAPDGRIAVGAGGGTVTGEGGVELRIPDGALDKAASFKIEAFGPELFPERPPLDGANFGSGLKIESNDAPVFNKEVKLAFPKPADAPDGAFYYVYRRLAGPDGKIIFQTLDHAFVEGEGASAKVVSASPPFDGYSDSYGGYHLTTFGGVILESAFINYAVLMWTFDIQAPGVPLPGVVTGKILRPKFIPGKADPVFEGVPGVTVVPLSSNKLPLYDLGLATSQKDGTFTLFAPFFHGGNVGIQACDQGHCEQATAFELSVIDTKTIFDFAGPLLRYYKNIAAANITFPPLPATQPPPQLQLSMLQADSNGILLPTSGPILAGSTVVVQVTQNADSATVAKITGGTLQGQPYGIRVNPADPNGAFLDPDITPTAPGMYKVTATALPALGGSPITASLTFLVIGAGGSNSQVLNGQPPDVLTSQLSPKNNAQNVPTTILPQVVFSEPVNNVRSNVSLMETDSSGAGNGLSVSIKVSGLGVTPGSSTVVPIENISDSDTVASITIRPEHDLKYGTYYKISLGSGITDLDKDANGNPAPNHLAGTPPNKEFVFKTFGPEELSTTDSFSSPRIAIVGTNAYVTNASGVHSQLMEYDISDPVTPVLNTEPGGTAWILGRSQDVSGVEAFPGTSGGLVGVATGAGALQLPSNIFFYDVADPNNIQRVGAVSVTGSASQEGTILHMVMKGNFAYTTTFQKGIQVVDISQAIQNYKTAAANPQTFIQFGFQITQDGEGFGRDAVVNTIPVMTTAFGPTPVNATLYGLAAGDLNLDQQTQTLVVASGVESLVVVDPIAGQVLAQSTQLQAPNGTMTRGFMIGLGNISGPCPSGFSTGATNCDVAAVVGNGPSGPILVVVDMTDPRHPVPVGALTLDDTALDVVIKDNTALVATPTKTELIDIQDPAHPTLIGVIDGIGGRLSLSGFLFGTAGGGTNGLHIAALGALAFVRSFEPKAIVVSSANQLFTNVRINYGIIPPDPDVHTAEVHIDTDGGSRAATLPGSLSSGKGSVVWPAGTPIDVSKNYFATVHAQSNGSELPTVAKRVPFTKLPVAFATLDKMLRIQFALPDAKVFTDSQNNPIDKYKVEVYLNADGTGTPAFTVTSKDIENAYPNTDNWFNSPTDGSPIVDGTDLAKRTWVTRKIDKLSNTPSLISQIKMQAFEIGTVASGYSAVYVKVISETTGDLVTKAIGISAPDNNWATIVEKVASKVDQAPQSTSTGGVLDNGGMIYRVLLKILDAVGNYQFEVLHGLLDGFVEGLEGDAQVVGSVFDAVLHPVKTAQALADFFGKLVTTLRQINFSQLIQGLYAGAGSFLKWPTLDEAVLLAGKAGYFFGYLGGMIIELVLSTVVIGFVTGGIGAMAEKALEILRTFDWIANIIEKALVVIRFLGYWLEKIASVATNNVVTKSVVAFLRSSADALVQLANKYEGAAKIIRALEQTWELSADLCKEAFEWLEQINKMSEEAGERFVKFIGNKGKDKSEQLLARWLGKANGKLAIKDAAEAYEHFELLGEGAADALTAAAGKVDTESANYAKQFADRYKSTPDGDRVNSALTRWRLATSDTRYSDDALGTAMKVLSDPAVTVVEDEAIEGAARFEQVTLNKFSSDTREAMLREIGMTTDSANDMLKFVQSAEDEDVIKGIADMLEEAPCPVI